MGKPAKFCANLSFSPSIRSSAIGFPVRLLLVTAIAGITACSVSTNESDVDARDNQAQAEAPVLSDSEDLAHPSPIASSSVESSRTREIASLVAPAKQSVALMDPGPPTYTRPSKDRFDASDEHSVVQVAQSPISTFSVDVDTVSYSYARRQLNQGFMPQRAAVRVEEMVNYFDYQYPLPEEKEAPFATTVSVTDAPWAKGNQLLHIGIKGYLPPADTATKTNLVFLLDVSGSMGGQDRLPLVKQSLEMLLESLSDDDRIAIVVYAGAAGVVLEPTPATDSARIMAALNRLQAGGSTAGGEGIQLAYELAAQHFDVEAVNRVILATDGDFNVGISDPETLTAFVEAQRRKQIYLSVLGFGQGNYNDALMQQLAQNGNGTAAYIDTLGEAQKVLVHEATSALFPIADDLKVQVEFNPTTVSEYRLIGYESRALEREDFNNDGVDAGDIGAGHTVTAIYEFTPTSGTGLIDTPRYPSNRETTTVPSGDSAPEEYANVRLRYKLPGETESRLLETPVDVQTSDLTASLQQEINFSIAVAGFAQLLRGGDYIHQWDFDQVIDLAQQSKGDDPYGYRTEFVQLARRAKIAKIL